MAFVLAATTFQTGITALSSYFVPIDGSFDTIGVPANASTIVNFVSGVDYYVEGNQYTAGNALKIENTSPKLKHVRYIIGSLGTTRYYFPWVPNDPTKNNVAKTINFSLFNRLSSFSAEGNSGGLETLDFRGLPMKHIAMWGLGGVSAVHLTNIPFWQGSETGSGTYGTIDLRNGTALSALNISGCNFRSVNLSDNRLSAFEFYGGTIYDLAAGGNPYRNKHLDFSGCDTLFLSSLNTLQLSRWNLFSFGDFTNNKLNSINLKGPLSSLRVLDVANHNLSSLNVPYLPELKVLYMGGTGRNQEGNSPFDPQYPLSATSITLDALTGLESLYMDGIGPMSNSNQITGMDRLSSLRLLWTSNNTNNTNNSKIKFTDLDLSIIPTRQFGSGGAFYGVGGVYAANCTFLTAVSCGKHSFNYINSFFDLSNCSSLSSLNMSSMTGVNSVSFGGTYLNESRVAFPTPLNNINQFYIGASQFTNVDTTAIPCNLIIFNTANALKLSSVNLDNCTRMLFLTLYNNPLLQTLSLSSLSTMQTANIEYTGILDLDWQNCFNTKYITINQNPALSTFTGTYYLTSLRGLNLYTNNSLKDFSLLGVSAIDTLDVEGNNALSSIQSDVVLNSLSSIDWSSDNASLSTVLFSNCPKLSYAYFAGGHSINNLFLNDNPVMTDVSVVVTDSSQLSSLVFKNDPSLKRVVYYSGISYPLQSLDFENAFSIRVINLFYTSLTSLKFLENGKIDTLGIAYDYNINDDIVTDLSLGSYLSSVNFTGTYNIFNLDKINLNNLTNLKEITFYSCSISSVNHILQNLPNKSIVTRLNFDFNSNIGLDGGQPVNQTINGLLLSSFDKIQNISFGYTNGSYIDWDSIMLGLCANPNIGTSNSVNLNIAGGFRDRRRSRYSNLAFTTLSARTVQNGYQFSITSPGASNLPYSATVPRAKPFINNVSYNPTLQYTTTTDIIPDTRYFDTSVTTYLSVVSGPGILTNSTTLSALSSNGTVAVLLSTIRDNQDTSQFNGLYSGLFASVSSYAYITLAKLDLSNSIVFTGLNKIYTGSVISASASVAGYPSLPVSLTYYYSGAPVTPVDAGYYTVSATIVSDDYTGTSITTLSVLNLNDFYSIPASAASSFIYFPRNCATEKDIVLSFDYAYYGSNSGGNEGFSVVFADTSNYNTPITGGGPGKALNYTGLTTLSAQGDTFTYNTYPGRFKGWLGIGFDASGNYALSSIGVPGLATGIPNSICLRDNYLSAYSVMHRTESLNSSAYKTPVTLFQATTGMPDYKSVRIRLTNLGKKLIVDMKPLSSRNFINYLTYDLPVALPQITNVSLGYSSGETDNTFKVKNFNLNYFDKEIIPTPYDLFGTYFVGPGEFGGDGITYSTAFNYSFFYNAKVPVSLPYTMDIYVNSIYLANVLFDPVYLNESFGLLNNTTGQTTYSVFTTGSVYL